ncbi:hypothetical protein COU17_00640 [Candidatus Kaiserbacteria bacterium CG10_big_fil_rev_8_21_14_0_10_49_17]|uniref:Uncharacterized protein n=1 Tax=Candidatus Kaiserbacteria bacterium CG10_big_fil_rev_8_21_14_0_10_49_17 TaxID=1974609 RepID=A0A2M6WFA8_9BACT|nr:MAG: hypothetical protein COU17_00640 [Candidatus Kaiserbacteria bacterium CG10_big_fil_rev_8_21_14_0_10_49_17]
MRATLRAYIPQLIIFAAIIISGSILFLPNFVGAQTISGGIVPCQGPECQLCYVNQLLQNILNFLVLVAAIVGALMLAIAGVLWMANTGNEKRLKLAKRIFSSVVIGLIIILGAWLIIDTILKVMTNNTQNLLLPWNGIACQQKAERPGSTIPEGVSVTSTAYQSCSPRGCYATLAQCEAASGAGNCQIRSVITTSSGTGYCYTGPDGVRQCHATQQACESSQALSGGSLCSKQVTTATTVKAGTDTRDAATKAQQEAQARAELAKYGIVVNKGACPPGVSYKATPGGCTDVSRLTSSSKNFLIGLAQSCNCKVWVTGGSEAGHKTHDDGNRLDLSFNTADGTNKLATWTKNNLTYIRPHSIGTLWKDPSGRCWLREKDHWHVNTTGACD